MPGRNQAGVRKRVRRRKGADARAGRTWRVLPGRLERRVLRPARLRRLPVASRGASLLLHLLRLRRSQEAVAVRYGSTPARRSITARVTAGMERRSTGNICPRPTQKRTAIGPIMEKDAPEGARCTTRDGISSNERSASYLLHVT